MSIDTIYFNFLLSIFYFVSDNSVKYKIKCSIICPYKNFKLLLASYSFVSLGENLSYHNYLAGLPKILILSTIIFFLLGGVFHVIIASLTLLRKSFIFSSEQVQVYHLIYQLQLFYHQPLY